ncbi:hypothetical protein [Tessaracoccus coleopterorum]|uniref:hypothetical protein n=1 Tax=Tessaracoccus coleopterorum TaxID=2714950 RepID=UPI0018D3A4A1|nr:hypothetical protein [Tessaracoccus coleopterorum]
MHLEQYRHATRSPEPYWEEALRRDPGDTRTNTAMGARRYHDGRLDEAETHLRRAVARLVKLNPNPATARPTTCWAWCCWPAATCAGGRGLRQAGWNAAWKAPSELALARIAATTGEWGDAVRRAGEVLTLDTRNSQARAIRVIGLRALGRDGEAAAELSAARLDDPLDWWLRSLDGDTDADAATLIDVALEFASLGRLGDSLTALDSAERRERDRPVPGMSNQIPLIRLHRADLLARSGEGAAADDELAAVTAEGHRGCFPAGSTTPSCSVECMRPARPRRCRRPARPLALRPRPRRGGDRRLVGGPQDPVSLRNRGVAAFNHQYDAALAVECYDEALRLSPRDPRLWFERDQLARQLGEPLEARITRLEAVRDMVAARDDLTVEYTNLLIRLGRLDEAHDLLLRHEFHPWEGGEGRALAAWEDANLGLARRALSGGDAEAALASAEAAWAPCPPSARTGTRLPTRRTSTW